MPTVNSNSPSAFIQSHLNPKSSLNPLTQLVSGQTERKKSSSSDSLVLKLLTVFKGLNQQIKSSPGLFVEKV